MKGIFKRCNRGMALPFALGLIVVLTGLAFTLDATVMRSYKTLQSFEYRCQLRSVMEELVPILLEDLHQHPSHIAPGPMPLPQNIQLPPGIFLSEMSLQNDTKNGHWILSIEMKRVFGDASIRIAWWVRFTVDPSGALFIVSIDEI